MGMARWVTGYAAALAGLSAVESHAAGSALICREDGSEAVVSTLPSQGLRDLLRLEFAPARQGDAGTYRLVQLDGKRIRVFTGAAACEIVVEGAAGPGPVAKATPPVQSPGGTTAAAPGVPKEAPKNEPQDKPGDKPAKDAYKPADELSVPSAPAFDIIGATPDLASLPKTPRDLAAHLVAGRSPDGTFQKGVAIDASLGQLLKALPFVGEDLFKALAQKKVKRPTWYDNTLAGLPGGAFKASEFDFETRFVNRLKFSLATTQEEEKADAPLNLGLGMHYTVWDFADRDSQCDNERDLKALEAERGSADAARASCQMRLQGKRRLFGSSSAAIGWARAYSLEDGAWGRRKPGARGLWATVATGSIGPSTFESRNSGEGKDGDIASDPVELRAQMIFHYRNLKDQLFDAGAEQETPPATQLLKMQDVSQWAVRIKMGKPHGSASFEYAKANRKVHGEGQLVTSRRAFGLEWKLADNLWLVSSAGREATSALGGKSQSFVNTNLRYALPDTPK